MQRMIPIYEESQTIVAGCSPVVRERFKKIQQTREIFETLQSEPTISLSAIQQKYGISRALASKLRKQLDESGGSIETAIAYCSPYKTNKTILGLKNEIDIATTLDNCVALDIPVSISELRQVMQLTAKRRRSNHQSIPENYPSLNTVKKFMKDYGFTRLKGHLMSTNFQKGERIEKVAAYANLWTKVFKDYPETENTMRIFNLDETLLDLSKGQESSFIVRQGAENGIKRPSYKNERFTIVVITCAAGTVVPPILVIPRYPRSIQDKQIVNELLPEGATLLVNPSSCTNCKLLVDYIEHFNAHVRKRISQDKKVILVLDGHPSRDARDKAWLQKAEELNIIVIVSPSCTSHYLQPNDQLVNRKLKQTVRASVDLSKKAVIGFDKLSVLQQQMAVCRQALKSLTESVVTTSWHQTLITPLDFDTFLARWKDKWAKFRIQAGLLLGDSVYEAGITSERERQLLVQIVHDQESRNAHTATQASQNGVTDARSGDVTISSNRTSSIRTIETDADIVGKFLANLETATGLPVVRAFESVDSVSKTSIIGSMAHCGVRLSDAIVKTMGQHKRRLTVKPGQDFSGAPRALTFSQPTPEPTPSTVSGTLSDVVVQHQESTIPAEHNIVAPLPRKRSTRAPSNPRAPKRLNRALNFHDLESSSSLAEDGGTTVSESLSNGPCVADEHSG